MKNEKIWGWRDDGFQNVEGYQMKMSRGQWKNRTLQKQILFSSMKEILESRKYFSYLSVTTYLYIRTSCG